MLIESRPYESLAALIQGELNDLEFGDLSYASDEQIAMFHAQEEVSGKEAPSLDPAVQPVVTIVWSESDKLQEGEQLPLARADALLRHWTRKSVPSVRSRATQAAGTIKPNSALTAHSTGNTTATRDGRTLATGTAL